MDQEHGSGSGGNVGGSGGRVGVGGQSDTHHLVLFFEDRSGYKKYNQDFEELNPLANGTTGVVFRCRKVSDQTECAVKIKRDHLETKDEVEIMSKLNHPNIVRFHESWMEAAYVGGERATFISMELCPTGFHDYMKEKSTIQEIWITFHQLLDGLDYVHFKDIVHNDLTIHNIMVGKDGKLKISDFGQGRFVGQESEQEKLEAKSKDVYKLGQILSWMILPRNLSSASKQPYRTKLLKKNLVNEDLVYMVFPPPRIRQAKRITTSQVMEINDEDGQRILQLIKDVQSQ